MTRNGDTGDHPVGWRLIDSVDRRGMMKLVRAFPEQCRDAASIAATYSPVRGDFRNVVILGMGGSAVGGDLLRVLLEAEDGTLPVVVTRDYQCPAFVDHRTLCIAASYSGNTEETLAATRDALKRGASVLPITTGGELERLVPDAASIRIPGGQPPRSALGYMFLPALIALSRIGICRDFAPDISEAITELDQLAAACDPDADQHSNPGQAIARSLERSLPAFYGSSAIAGVVAFRWKCQFNENAKRHAIWNVLPELDHNEICGWRTARYQGKFRWVFIRNRSDSVRVNQRLEITRSVLASNSVGHTDVWGSGDSNLSRALTAILLGDFVSTYVAVYNGIDPTDIGEIDLLKSELERQAH